MNHIERFLNTVERKPVDRPASWLGIPDAKSYEGLYKHFDVSEFNQFKKAIDDDVYHVEMPYHSPTSDAIYAAFDFAKQEPNTSYERTLTSPGFFEEYTNPEAVDDFDWPDPEKYIDTKECANVVNSVPDGYAVMGVVWSAHFQDACAAFGMETALMKMITEPKIFKAVIDKITDFYLTANEIFFDSTKGKLHAVLIGNDLGSQTGLMLSPQMIREFVLPGTKKLIAQAKSYGLKVVHHSCGSIYDIIPDLIEAGADVIHPIQALAKNMEAQRLKKDFGDNVSFCGGVDAQNLLVNGSSEEVRAEVMRLKKLFETGLVISPSHEAILPDISPKNIEALFSAIK